MTIRYFDNAATSYPKPREVTEALARYMTEIGAPGRGLYESARVGSGLIHECRERIAQLVNLPHHEDRTTQHGNHERARRVIFGYNTTDALNLAAKGALWHALASTPGQKVHVVTTNTEHNSILRPIHAMIQQLGDHRLGWTKVRAHPTTGLVDPEDALRAVQPGVTALVAINHASNVTGALQDIRAIGRGLHGLCQRAGLDGEDRPLFLIDAAQSIGHVEIDMTDAHVDLLAFPGHKGLLGPQGTGGLALAPGVHERVHTIREGGTGNSSENPEHPATLPEKYEAGSHNTPGIVGLSQAVGYLLKRSIRSIRTHEVELSAMLLEAFENPEDHGLSGLRLLGNAPVHQRVGVFSLVHESLQPAELSAILESQFKVMSRAGLHCAPLVHEQMGTIKSGGACRVSLGPMLGVEDVRYLLDSLRQVCRKSTATPAISY